MTHRARHPFHFVVCVLLFGGAAAVALASTPFPAAAQVSLPSPADAPVASYEPEPARDHAFPLTLQEMMRGNEIVGQSPTGVSWTDDSR